MVTPIAGAQRLLHRITGLFALVFCVSVSGNALYTAYEQSEQTQRQLERNALSETRVIAEQNLRTVALDNDTLRPMLSGHTGFTAVAVIAADGRILSALNRTSQGMWIASRASGFDAPPSLPHPDVRTVTPLSGRGSSGAHPQIVSWVPLKGAGAAFWLRTETGTAEAREVWRHILIDSLLHGLIALLIGIAALHALLRRPLAALQQCTGFAERLDRSAGETLPVVTGSHETDRLAQALNWASLSLYDQRSALAESEARTGAIMSAAIDAVITFDAFGNVIEYNPAAERMLGWTATEAMQRPVIELLVPRGERERDETDLLQWLGRRFDAVIGQHLDVNIMGRDGRSFPAELAITSSDMKGRTLFTAFVSDISERKAIQEQIMHARDAAEAANRAKSDFLANMSHEIRTPMNAIMGMTDLALDTELTVEQHEYLSLVKQSADSLLTLIDDILDFSKIEAGHLSFEEIPFSLREVVGGIVRTLKPKPGKPVQLDCHIDPSVADGVVGDPTRLRQVLINLLSNALKFTERGQVEVSVTLEDVTPDAQALRFEIRDTGIGIPLDKQALIFDAFSQADTSTTRKFGGTGLGLAICRRLVERMNGTMGVVSAPGEGSTFHFTALFQRARSGDVAQRRPGTLDNMAVLVIEPDPATRMHLGEQLSHWHVLPRLCAGIDEGIGALVSAETEARCFRAVLVAHSVAHEDDWALVRMLTTEYGATLPVILLQDGSDNAADNRPDGICGSITRPVEATALLDALMAAIGSDDDRQLRVAQQARRDPRPLHILLAEDNPVNQTLAVRLLERLGHRVDVAGNGIEAVGMAGNCRFDMILMDIQMPQMGGFEATRHIRAQDGQRHTPIVAMTAHALAGDREKCLDAGMDGYVSKPIQVPALLRALDEALAGPAFERPAATPIVASDSRFDRMFMLGNLAADEELMHEIIRIFLRDYRSNLDALQKACSAGSREELIQQAHTLKGMVRNFGASCASGIAARLERRSGDAAKSGGDEAAMVDQLIEETEALAAELRAELLGHRQPADRSAA
jgi:two-component system sensor histidine kinase/response regulator